MKSYCSILIALLMPFFLSYLSNCGEVIEIDIYKQDRLIKNVLSKKVKRSTDTNNKKNEDVSLYKFMNREYFGFIGIGSPSKEFKMIFDTTWTDTWVPSKHCSFLEIACLIHTQYDSSRSSTYQEDGTYVDISDSFSSLKGFLSIDNFHLAHLEVQNQTFIETTHLSRKPYLFNKADGIIGLGFMKSSHIHGKSFFYNMMYQKLVEKPVFTFYMNRDETTEKAGRLIIGGTERKHVKGNLTVIPVIGKTAWKINLDRIVLDVRNRSHVFGQQSEAYLDTSGNFIKGPAREIYHLNNLLNAYDIGSGIYMVNCRDYAKLPPVNIVLQNRVFQIESKYYILKMTFQGVQACFSPFKGYQNSNTTWLLGGAFLMQFYTEYDYNAATITIGETVF